MKFVLLSFIALICFNASAKISITSHDAWINPISLAVNKKYNESKIDNGFYYLLHDEQINIYKEQHYYHYAYKIISSVGVQNASEISTTYNPSYQKFIIHNIKVIRNGISLDKTKTARITEMQRETELEEKIYNEEFTVLIILDDIRAGDIVEYDYSINGNNPVFNNVFYYNCYFSYNYPLTSFNFQLIKPLNRNLEFKEYNCDSLNLIKSNIANKSFETYTWKGKDIRKLEIEKGIPLSFNPYYSIEISEYNNWEQVNNWAYKLFINNEVSNSKLTKLINSIKNSSGDLPEKIIESVRFVQNNIRYLGIEIGTSSHKPSTPNQTLERRFGDCKDKSLLLCKILNELGVSAAPVLLNTFLGASIKNRLISPLLFNHCIVRVQYNNRDLWFDPTITFQGGDIENCYLPDYQTGLVIDGKTNELQSITSNNYCMINVNSHFLCKNFSSPALLQIETTYEGGEADRLRNIYATYSNTTIDEYRRQSLSVYYTGIRTVESSTFIDDTIKNIFTVTENFEIDNFWFKNDSINSEKIVAEICGESVIEKLRSFGNVTPNRTMPLSIDYPMHITQSVEIDLPERWLLKSKEYSETIDCCLFRYKQNASGRKIFLFYEVVTYSNQVNADKVNTFLKRIDSIISQYGGINLYRSNDKFVEHPQINLKKYLIVFFIILFVIVIGATIIIALVIYLK